MIFDIKRFAINDGPGIRTTFFLKGCPLHCVWCHNPEGISSQSERLFNAKKCIGCEDCKMACPQGLDPRQLNMRKEECLQCGACTDVCPTKALERAGRNWSMEEMMQLVEKERTVMEESGGGVTLCGGEPLMHPEESLSLLEELGRRDIHRTVDTTLYASRTTVERIAEACELLLVDLKHMDNAKHRQYTGVENHIILDNIKHISEMGHPYWIRIPLIVGVNADEENLKASARFLVSLPTPPEIVNLLVYHDIGKGKHERLHTQYNPEGITMKPPTAEEQQRALSIFEKEGLKVKIGG